MLQCVTNNSSSRVDKIEIRQKKNILISLVKILHTQKICFWSHLRKYFLRDTLYLKWNFFPNSAFKFKNLSFFATFYQPLDFYFLSVVALKRRNAFVNLERKSLSSKAKNHLRKNRRNQSKIKKELGDTERRKKPPHPGFDLGKSFQILDR